MKICSKNTRICAMCVYWNGAVGGKEVRPKKGMTTFFEYEPEEKNICYKTHMDRKAWTSCSSWTQKF